MKEETYSECAERWVRDYGLDRSRMLADLMYKSSYVNARHFYWQVGMVITLHGEESMTATHFKDCVYA